ncbi:hypothetical protein ELI15_14210 [Rhizobium ruizarguesonis]|uniref:hypothetical protein n=1 Tax=Rhizobium ruizarguesonis TaxID=2081791 RepID=UPI00102FA2DC|nr:hypothetical protein [Rhizobium ruizarguesonis]TAW65444.1 hypothetical protein ELI15_14210 [Rhizobium ruizarguesonis]
MPGDLMLKSIAKLFSKKPSEPPAPSMSPEEQAAFDKGREISNAQITQIEQYISFRYDQMRSGYLGVIQKQLDAGRQQEEYSPILFARVEYSLYMQHVKEAEAKLKAEVKTQFAEWDDLNQQMGVEELMDTWLSKTLSDRFTDLTFAGLKVLQDNADILKTADDNWRKKFPTWAAEQPLD